VIQYPDEKWYRSVVMVHSSQLITNRNVLVTVWIIHSWCPPLHWQQLKTTRTGTHLDVGHLRIQLRGACHTSV